MTFNPSKCKYLKISNKLHSISTQQSYYQRSTTRQVFGCYLTWNEHISYVTSRANKVKCFLQRNLSHYQEVCYHSLIRSILDYASIIWSPYTQKNIQRCIYIQPIESVQRRAARFVANDYSSSTSVTIIRPFSHRRNELRLLMFYKIIQHLVDINTDSLLIPKPSIHITRCHDMRFLQPSTRINA